MAIVLGRSGQNLTIKPIAGSEEREEKKRIMDLKIQKIPIYRADTFLYWEINLSNLPLIYKMWSEDNIIIDLKAKDWIDTFKYNKNPLKDLQRTPLTVFPIAEWQSKFKLKDYQIDFAEIDHNKKNMALFLDTGSGKCICLLLRALNLGAKRILVFTSKGNFSDWQRDCRNVFGLNCVPYTGNKEQRSKIDIDSAPVIVTNYEQAKEIKARLRDSQFDALILDEADDAANPTTGVYKELQIIKGILKDRVCTLAATATPLESRLEPLWGLLSLVDSFAAGRKDEFLSKFQEPIQWKEMPGRNGGTFEKPIKFRTKNLTELREFLSTIAYRVDTTQSFNFVVKPEVYLLGMTDQQWNVYDGIKEEIEYLAKSGDLFAGNPLPKFAELFQVAEGLWGDTIHSEKYEWICDYVSKSSRKTMIISGYVAPTEAYYERFKDRAVIYNGTKSNNHKELAKLAFQGASDPSEEERFYELSSKVRDFPFKKPGDAQLFICTSSSKGGRGMNLSNCEEQIYSSLSLSSRATKQTSGRNKRATTKYKVLYQQFLVSKGTIDQRYLGHVFDKIKNVSLILDGECDMVVSGRDLLRMMRDKDELGL